MSEKDSVYAALSEEEAERYSCLIKEEARLLSRLLHSECINNSDLISIQQKIYEIKQDAGLISSR
jgi:hypothetical protein